MKWIINKVRSYLYNVDIDINERLGVFFVNIGIVAAILGLIISLLEHAPVSGTIATALIVISAPLIISLSLHTGRTEYQSSMIAIMAMIMIPIVWLLTGGLSGGSTFWFLYELFYITLFASKKRLLPLYSIAILLQAIAVAAYWFYPDLFFHFTDQTDIFISIILSGIVVTAEILFTVVVQKSLYIYEREINTQVRDMTYEFVTSIANTIDTKDTYTGGHSRRVAECASAIAGKLGMSEAEINNIYFIGLLHDIGKIGIPDRVLNKAGKLTNEEFSLIRRHPEYGAEIMKDFTEISHLHDGILYHHERYDGTGYPEGLKGEEIPFVARIIAVADSYDAMSTTRIYRKHLKSEDIIAEIQKGSGTQFDPHIVKVFIQMLNEGFSIKGTVKSNTVDFQKNMDVASNQMMQHIMAHHEQNQSIGGTNVDNADFVRLYDYLVNLSLRYGNNLILCNISLNTDRTDLTHDQILAYAADLNTAITKSIRSADICTRNSNSSCLVLLMNSSHDNVAMIIDRISKEFYRLLGNKDVTLNYEIIETNRKYPEHSQINFNK